MNCSGTFKCNNAKNLLKITIEVCDVDSNSFESFVDRSDHKSLHPNYESKHFQISKQKFKFEKKKLSGQIENFIKINFPHPAEGRESLEIFTVSSAQEQNEIEKIVSGKMKATKKNTVCTSACIIG